VTGCPGTPRSVAGTARATRKVPKLAGEKAGMARGTDRLGWCVGGECGGRPAPVARERWVIGGAARAGWLGLDGQTERMNGGPPEGLRGELVCSGRVRWRRGSLRASCARRLLAGPWRGLAGLRASPAPPSRLRHAPRRTTCDGPSFRGAAHMAAC
jgi:hypothetical protein